jgi:hypothetical protein
LAANGIDLSSLAVFYGVPYGTVARWAHEQRWPVVRRRSQRLGLPQLYDIDAVARLSGHRLEARKAA